MIVFPGFYCFAQLMHFAFADGSKGRKFDE
jgi:hypothetical protein